MIQISRVLAEIRKLETIGRCRAIAHREQNVGMVPVAADGGMPRRVGLKIETDFQIRAERIAARRHLQIGQRISDIAVKMPGNTFCRDVVRSARVYRNREAPACSRDGRGLGARAHCREAAQNENRQNGGSRHGLTRQATLDLGLQL